MKPCKYFGVGCAVVTIAIIVIALGIVQDVFHYFKVLIRRIKDKIKKLLHFK